MCNELDQQCKPVIADLQSNMPTLWDQCREFYMYIFIFIRIKLWWCSSCNKMILCKRLEFAEAMLIELNNVIMSDEAHLSCVNIQNFRFWSAIYSRKFHGAPFNLKSWLCGVELEDSVLSVLLFLLEGQTYSNCQHTVIYYDVA